MNRLAEQVENAVNSIPEYEAFGRVTKILGLLVEIAGFGGALSIGAMVHLRPDKDTDIPCEVIGFRDSQALLMPFGTLEGVGLGCEAYIQSSTPTIFPTSTLSLSTSVAPVIKVNLSPDSKGFEPSGFSVLCLTVANTFGNTLLPVPIEPSIKRAPLTIPIFSIVTV